MLLATVLALLVGVGAGVNPVFTVSENTPNSSTIGNFWEKTGLKASGRLFVVNSNSFHMDEDGNLRLSRLVDREDPKLCKEFDSEGNCELHLSVLRNNDIFGIDVKILDVNDNKPKFREATKRLSMPETPSDFPVLLDAASDPDAHGMQRGRYQLIDKSKKFQLNTDGGLSLRLQQGQTVDYEKKRKYELQLEACDSGNQCTSQELIIDIIDSNDNEPKVLRVDSPGVSEDASNGSVVATVFAEDADSGKNGLLTFRVADGHEAEFFHIADNGSVMLLKKLNAGNKSQWNISFFVSDSGSPPRIVSHRFTVKVSDVNDHAPLVEVKPIADSVREGTKPPINLAFVVVSDGDLGNNAEFRCHLIGTHSHMLSLRQLEQRQQLMVTVNQTIDYEDTPQLQAAIFCFDFGTPQSLNSTKEILVQVEGINEFTPELQVLPSNYVIINESMPVGYTVRSLVGSDGDRGDNLTFALVGDRHVTQFFEIVTVAADGDFEALRLTQARAYLKLAKRLDRDSLRLRNDTMRFTVTVSDSGNLLTSKSLTLILQDVNDNAPLLEDPKEFNLPEDCHKRSIGLRQLRYSDKDINLNKKATFRLVRLSARVSSATGQMHIIEWTNSSEWPLSVTTGGYIKCTKYLDREQYSQLLLTVQLTNSMAEPQLSSTGQVTVNVLDVNDNSPTWRFPSPSGDSVNVSARHPVGEEITRVEAFDPDLRSNVTYALMSSSEYFGLDSVNGAVWPSRRLNAGSHQLKVRADDNGPDRNRFALATLTINVLPASDAFSMLREAQFNLAIILAMIVITAVISLLLVSAIVCVRRRTQQLLPPTAFEEDECGKDCHCLPDQHKHQLLRYPLTTFSADFGKQHLQPRHEVAVNLQDFDGDSADSGRGGSEDGNLHMLPRRLMSPPPHMRSPCQCLGIPEEEQQAAESFLPASSPPPGVEFVAGSLQQRCNDPFLALASR